MIDTTWSRLLHTPMGEFVRQRMNDPRLKYHNIQHVMRLYAKAAEWHLHYDAHLDAAILWHDAVYDELPDKERRSAELMADTAEAHPEWFAGLSVPAIYELIMTTQTHQVEEGVPSLMIKLDLAELADPVKRRENFWSILEESCELYGIDRRAAALGSEKFMTGFLDTVKRNHAVDQFSDMFHYDGDAYWSEVTVGVREVITMSVTVQDSLDRFFI